MRTVQWSVEVESLPPEVFSLVTDENCDRNWMLGVIGTENFTPGEMRKGTEMVCKFGVGGLTTMKANAVIDEFEPGRRFVRRRVGGAMAMKGDFTVEPAGIHTTVVWKMEVGMNMPVAGMLLDPLLAAWMKMSMKMSLRNLKRLAESKHLATTQEMQGVSYNS